MKVFSHEKPGTVVRANAAQCQLLLDLFKNNLVSEPERAIRLAGKDVFTTFHNFSGLHIQEAIDEAAQTKAQNVLIAAYSGTKEQHEARVKVAKAKAAAAHALVPKAPPAFKPAVVPFPAPTPTPTPVLKPVTPSTTVTN